MKRVIRASAPGKLVLLGEYAVLEGAPALVAAVDRRARVRVSDSESRESIIRAPELGVGEQRFLFEGGRIRLLGEPSPLAEGRLSVLVSVLEQVATQLGRPLSPVEIETSTRSLLHVDPQGAVSKKLGVGASAAVAVAGLAALSRWAEPNASLSAPSLFGQALRAHRRAQGGAGSGIDVAASTWGGVLCYELAGSPEGEPVAKPTQLPPGLSLQVVATGEAASTPNLVAKVKSLAARDAHHYRALFAELGALARLGCELADKSDVSAFVRLAHEYGKALGRLGQASGADIVSAPHAALAAVVERAGGGYKPSGAGGGDVGIAFADGPELARRVEDAIRGAGGHLVEVAVDPTGCEVN